VRAFLVGLFVAACRPATPPAPFTLRIAVSGPLDRLEPNAERKSWTIIAEKLVYENLLGIGRNGEVVPVLAAKVELAGGRGLKVWLRSDARFSDGARVTFADVASSLSRSGLEAEEQGDHLLIRSRDPTVPAEVVLSQTSIFRRAGQQTFGAGAFAVQEEDASHILLVRTNPAPGFIERVNLISYSKPQDAFAHTLKGDADMFQDVEPRWVEFFEGVPRLRILRAPAPIANMVAFNLARLPRAERIDLTAALASDELRRLAFGDECPAPARRPAFKPLPPGPPLEILAVPFFDRFAFGARRALGPRGGEVRVAELQEFVQLLKQGTFDLATVRPRVSPSVMAALAWRTGAKTNWFGYSNAAVDAALDAHDWAAAERALEEDPPGAIICIPTIIVVIDSRIKTPPLESGRFIESIPQWEVAQ
jgi:hypothetical protein